MHEINTIGFCFLLSVSNAVTLYITITLLRRYYKKAFEKFGEELRKQYVSELKKHKDEVDLLNYKISDMRKKTYIRKDI